jgi:hypothetical protein
VRDRISVSSRNATLVLGSRLFILGAYVGEVR